jgi:MYXO-CTERM domain-containing protein
VRWIVGLAVILVGCGGRGGAVVERQVKPLTWGSEQELVASDAAELDQLGWSVALTTDHALVGAYGESNYRGAAYVFAKSANGWVEEQKLVAGDGVEPEKFGTSVALAGDRALIGTYDSFGHRGAVYVFVKTGSAWVEEQKLVPSDGAELDKFGWSVALSDDRALVGAYGSEDVRGAAYVFVRSGTSWREEQKLVAYGDVGDDFGWSVALAGRRALVGAPRTDTFRGAAHVFVRGSSSWTEEQTLIATDGVASDNFGTAVSLTDDRALVGAYWDDDLRGAAYVFVRNGADFERPWAEEQKLVANDGAEGHRFGNAVSLADDRALIGASGLGGAYVFARDGSTWSQEKRLLAGDAPIFDLFGWSVALAADQALIGASYTDQLRGAAYLFSLGVDNGDGGSNDAGGVDGPDGGVVDAAASDPGSCSRGAECASGHCEDGICCDRTCAASERCRAALKVAGEDGVCGPAKTAAPGAACSFDVQCTSGRCTGGVCCDTDCAPDAAGTGDSSINVPVGAPPADDGGCACRAASSPTNGPGAWLGAAVALLLARRMRAAR